jgi:aspartyl-tRNA synthetase
MKFQAQLIVNFQERITLTADNETSWLYQSRTVCKSVQVVDEVQALEMNEILGLNIGDTVYLATRPKTHEVRFFVKIPMYLLK